MALNSVRCVNKHLNMPMSLGRMSCSAAPFTEHRHNQEIGII